MLVVILTVVVAVGVGVGIERRSNAAAHRVRHLALQLMLWALVPFVAYVNIARLHLTVDAGLSILVSGATFVACGTLMSVLARGPLALPRPSTGAAIVSTIQANTAYLGLPLCAALFTHAQFTQAVAFDALISLPLFAFGSYSVGALYGRAPAVGLRSRVRATLLRNPVLPAVIAGLLVPDAWAPHALVLPSRICVFALLPPAVLAAATLLLHVPAPFFLLAAMPTGVNTVVVAHATGLDLRLIASSIAWTTTLALIGVALLEALGVV